MKKVLLVLASLCLGGCSSNSGPAPEEASIVPPANTVQPQLAATSMPPFVQAPTSTTSQAPENTLPMEQSTSQTSTDNVQASDDSAKRAEVEQLRENMRSYEASKQRVIDNQTSYRGNARDWEIERLNGKIADDQKKIDDLMMSR